MTEKELKLYHFLEDYLIYCEEANSYYHVQHIEYSDKNEIYFVLFLNLKNNDDTYSTVLDESELNLQMQNNLFEYHEEVEEGDLFFESVSFSLILEFEPNDRYGNKYINQK